MSRELVVVAMSGGVDSSVAAARLVAAGHEVVGMTMRVWTGEGAAAGTRSCCSLEDVDDARRVADHLGIDFYALDMKEPFRRRVVDDFVEEYLAGRTPNPCLRCNTDLKFGALLARARALGASRVATGHYVRLAEEGGRWTLRRGRDPGKDQSYALYGLTQAQLARASFPLGEATKAEVRAEAEALGLAVHSKPDSQDICFVPGGDYRELLEAEAGEAIEPGDFVDLEGRVVGRHRGVPFYTVGQRRGLGLQGPARTYVVALDAARNQVVVGRHAEAQAARFRVEAVNWVSRAAPAAPLRCQVKIRHRSAPAPAEVRPLPGGALQVTLEAADLGVTPGQACVLYDGDLVLGGGTIEAVEGAGPLAV